MIRFAWLQGRAQTLIGAAATTAVVVIAIITGLEVSHLYSSLVAHCQTVGDCPAATAQYASQQHFLQSALPFLLRLTPALLGIFWGAPLCAREFETGTFRLAWTQSVSRRRWLITKLVMGLAATVVVAGIVALAVTWWSRGFDVLSANQYANFDERDIAPIGYAAFAFTLGALVGAIVRRLLPAMAVSLAGFVAVRLAITAWVRPHLITPVHTLVALTSAPSFEIRGTQDGPILTHVTVQAPNMPNSWVQSVGLVTNSGHAPTLAQETAFLKQYCLPLAQPPQPASGQGAGPVRGSGNPATLANCQTQLEHVFRVAVSYQPPSRYWTLQWSELGIFIALAVAAGIGCYWWITRRA
jgi:ABC-2 family transporter protein